MSNRVVYYVARGYHALQEVDLSVETLRQYHDWPVIVASEQPLGIERIAKNMTRLDLPPNCDQGGRLAKIWNHFTYPDEFDQYLYLDADTRVYGPLDIGFNLLDAGWDLVITASQNQGDDLMWHVGEDERRDTINAINNPEPLALQAGVFWVRRTERTEALFLAWWEEWQKYRDQDQAALLRALHRVPVAVALVAQQFNGRLNPGPMVVGHRFGALREKTK